MQDTEVYIKTDAGRDEIKSRTLGLPMSVRAILLMVDGQRPVAAMRSLIAGSKAPANVLDALVAQGLIEPRNGVASAPAAIVAAAPFVAPVAPVLEAAEAVTPIAAAVAVRAGRSPLLRSSSPRRLSKATAESALRSVRWTWCCRRSTVLRSPSRRSSPCRSRRRSSWRLPSRPLVPAEATPTINRYEHLYTMMNEIVRDFLAPHRRYFLQLKIERCGTPDELLELLHDLQTALAKARGEAFASDVIARLRNAAA